MLSGAIIHIYFDKETYKYSEGKTRGIFSLKLALRLMSTEL
jgi:hypothetical protein